MALRREPSHPEDLHKSRALAGSGLGAWAFGGVGWGSQEDRDSISCPIHRAVELGINWIDTAAIYGNGHAEWIKSARRSRISPGERPLVYTKAGILIDAASDRTYRNLTPRSLSVPSARLR